MSTRLRLDHADPDVRARAHHAVTLPPVDGPSGVLRLRCARCGKRLALAWTTAQGAVFASSWPTDARFSEAAVVDGRQLSRSASRWTLRGREPHEVHGAIALLAEDDVPDLMVRCPEHGDAVVDRAAVLDRLRRGSAVMKVRVSGRREYDPPHA